MPPDGGILNITHSLRKKEKGYLSMKKKRLKLLGAALLLTSAMTMTVQAQSDGVIDYSDTFTVGDTGYAQTVDGLEFPGTECLLTNRNFTFTVDADSIIAKEKADTGYNIQVGSVWIAKVSGGTLIPVTISPYEGYSTIEIRSTNNGGYSLEGIDIQDNTTYGIMVEISGAPGESYNLSGCYASYFRIPSSGAAAGGVVSYSWLSDGKGWWVQGSDGTYLINQWYQDPATNLYYYMGPDGYMLTNSTTPDGYYVNGDGVWVESSSLQTAGRERQAVYDSEHGSFLEKKQVIYDYLEAIGYDTNGLTIKEGNIHYSSFSSGEESLYDLLAYDSQAVLNEISYYTNFGGNADKLIQAVENYLSQK